MKILAFADVHANEEALKAIEDKAKQADILLSAGDISIFENNLEILLKRLAATKKPVLIIPGNHEVSDEFGILADALGLFNIHNASLIIDEFIFMGYGGGGFGSTDKRFERMSKNFVKALEENSEKKAVLVTHAPPYKTQIDKIMGDHCGNKSIRDFIEKQKPHLAVSGHIHENSGKSDRIGSTVVINPGPCGQIIEL